MCGNMDFDFDTASPAEIIHHAITDRPWDAEKTFTGEFRIRKDHGVIMTYVFEQDKLKSITVGTK